MMTKLYLKVIFAKEKLKKAVKDNSGEGALDTAIAILISVVLAALLLAGLYALIGDTVMPSLREKIQSMFNYSGS